MRADGAGSDDASRPERKATTATIGDDEAERAKWPRGRGKGEPARGRGADRAAPERRRRARDGIARRKAVARDGGDEGDDDDDGLASIPARRAQRRREKCHGEGMRRAAQAYI